VSTPDTRDRLADLLAGPLASLGVDLEAVELSSAGRRRMLRVAVDKDGGPTMDDIAEATREVSRVLDRSEVMGEQPYTLEVSSRGVDRPLTLPRHWRRNRGRLVKVELAEPGTGETTLTGRITAVDDEAATLDVAGTERRIRYDDVRRARVQIEFKPTPSAEGDRKEG
jgi:ribosome maturation factor RimP